MNHSFISMLLLVLVTTSAIAQNATPHGEKQAPSDSYVMNAIFGDAHIADNAFTVHRRAMKMPIEERYEYLAKWVLPGADHADLRLALCFAPTNPAPQFEEEDSIYIGKLQLGTSSSESRKQTGGFPVAPALDLIETAVELGRLDDIRSRIDQAPMSHVMQQRRRLSMLVLTDIARHDFDSAIASIDDLFARVKARTYPSLSERWPETLVVWAGIHHPETRSSVQGLLFRMLQDQVRTGFARGPAEWNRMVVSLAGQLGEFDLPESAKKSGTDFTSTPLLKKWSPVSRTTSLTRGRGFPSTRWKRLQDGVEKLTSHNEDYLMYGIPLRGNFEVECDVTTFGWKNSHLSVFGNWVSPIYDHKTYAIGDFRFARPSVTLNRRLSEFSDWIRYRVVVRDGRCKTYFNGRLIHEETLPNEHDPWIAVRSPWYANSVVRSLRITGRPEIPERINISALANLKGWTPYYFQSVGGIFSDWHQFGALKDGGGIFGHRNLDLSGSGQESLLRYQRPMLEDGTIEYDFYYSEGNSNVHPTLDRRTFVLSPDGVRIHWVTDGIDDRTGLDPLNLFDEPENRRGPETLPLRQNDWNRIRLSLTGDTVRLSLNDKIVYRCELEPTNQRTFGLFHYADRTEVRVRNVVWTGNWPRELPAVAKQELAGADDNILGDRLPELTESFQHNFVIAGLPAELFSELDQESAKLIRVKSDGVHVSASKSKEYLPISITPKVKVCGDFDITVTFDGLTTETSKDGSSGISLQANLVDTAQVHSTLYRGLVRRSGTADQHVVQSMDLRRTQERLFMSVLGTTSEEATSGRLRLARRGNKIYSLFAEGDSSLFRLIVVDTIIGDCSCVESIQLTTATQGDSGSTSVTWKQISIRAESINPSPPKISMISPPPKQRLAGIFSSIKPDFNIQKTQ